MKKDQVSKMCSWCHVQKPLADFNLSRGNGVQSRCRECQRRERLEHGARCRATWSSSHPPTCGTKLCSRCKTERPVSDFYVDRSSITGRLSQCRECSAENRRKRSENTSRCLLLGAKLRAEKYGLPFDLSESDIVVPETCPALGIPLRKGDGHMCANSPTLDRIVPDGGYVRGNVAVISFRANTVKHNATSSELRLVADWIDSVSK